MSKSSPYKGERQEQNGLQAMKASQKDTPAEQTKNVTFLLMNKTLRKYETKLNSKNSEMRQLKELEKNAKKITSEIKPKLEGAQSETYNR